LHSVSPSSPLGAGRAIAGFGLQHAVNQLVAHRQRNRRDKLAGRQFFLTPDQRPPHMARNRLPQDLGGLRLIYRIIVHSYWSTLALNPATGGSSACTQIQIRPNWFHPGTPNHGVRRRSRVERTCLPTPILIEDPAGV
jgi:hypothetical protein